MNKKLLLTIAASFSLAVSSNAQDGILDPTFGNNGIVQTISTGEAFDMIIQPDDKIIVVGAINMGSGNDDIAIVRYNSDGSLDNTFGTNGIVNIDYNGKNDDASSVILQSDGKIIVVGRAQNTSNNNSDIAVIRLNTDGTLDNSFATGGKFQLDVDGYAFDHGLDVALQNDGKIVMIAMAGTDMFSRNAVIRLNTNGTLDNSFDGDGILKAFSFGTFNLSSLYALVLQSDGKILVGGSKNNNLAIARLNTDGSIDNTYGTSGVYTTATSVVTHCDMILQADGKLLATYSSITQTAVAVARLNSDGTIDTGFGNNGFISTPIGSLSTYDFTKGIVLQADGKFILTGSSYSSGSISDFLTIRYNSNGTIDNTFGASANGIVITSVEANDEDRGKAVKLQSDGKIVVAGSSCTGACDFVLLRYSNTNTGAASIDESSVIPNLLMYPNPAKDIVTIGNVPSASTVNITDITGRIVYSTKTNNEEITINTSEFVNGVYIIQVENKGSVANKKLVINK